MVFGMATTKITITLEDKQVDGIRELVAAAKSPSVSAFVKHAVDVALSDAEGWRAMMDDALMQTGGPLTNEERAWADELLDSVKSPEAGRHTDKRGPGRNKAA